MFEVARSPDAASRLPFLVRLPLPGGEVVLKAREPWPRTGAVYCHPADGEWPRDAELVDTRERYPWRFGRQQAVSTERYLGAAVAELRRENPDPGPLLDLDLGGGPRRGRPGARG
jgi:hypothetical protein